MLLQRNRSQVKEKKHNIVRVGERRGECALRRGMERKYKAKRENCERAKSFRMLNYSHAPRSKVQKGITKDKGRVGEREKVMWSVH